MRAGLAGVLCCVLLLGACRAPLEDGDDLQAARTAIAGLVPKRHFAVWGFLFI